MNNASRTAAKARDEATHDWSHQSGSSARSAAGQPRAHLALSPGKQLELTEEANGKLLRLLRHVGYMDGAVGKTPCVEALIIMTAIVLGLTLPITPVQMLWVNIITAVILGLALAFEPAEADVMSRKPRRPEEPTLSGFLICRPCSGCLQPPRSTRRPGRWSWRSRWVFSW